MSFDYSIFNSTNMMEQQCSTYCIQKMVDAQYNAMADIYTKFHGYLIGVIAFFIIYKVLEAIITASENHVWKFDFIFIKKEIPFNLDEESIKTVKWIKNILFGVMFSLSLVYYFVYGYLATLGY